MTNSALSIPSRPWYRQLWPWLIISLPLTAVLAGGVTWYLAWHSNDGLVADDYYKQGLEINRSLESQQMARHLGLTATLQQQSGTLILRLQAEREITFPPKLLLHIVSPVKAGQDREVALSGESGVYRGALGDLPAGHWNLFLEDEGGTWKLTTTAVFPLASPQNFKP